MILSHSCYPLLSICYSFSHSLLACRNDLKCNALKSPMLISLVVFAIHLLSLTAFLPLSIERFENVIFLRT